MLRALARRWVIGQTGGADIESTEQSSTAAGRRQGVLFPSRPPLHTESGGLRFARRVFCQGRRARELSSNTQQPSKKVEAERLGVDTRARRCSKGDACLPSVSPARRYPPYPISTLP